MQGEVKTFFRVNVVLKFKTVGRWLTHRAKVSGEVLCTLQVYLGWVVSDRMRQVCKSEAAVGTGVGRTRTKKALKLVPT